MWLEARGAPPLVVTLGMMSLRRCRPGRGRSGAPRCANDLVARFRTDRRALAPCSAAQPLQGPKGCTLVNYDELFEQGWRRTVGGLSRDHGLTASSGAGRGKVPLYSPSGTLETADRAGSAREVW
jgi:hypothetical protein